MPEIYPIYYLKYVSRDEDDAVAHVGAHSKNKAVHLLRIYLRDECEDVLRKIKTANMTLRASLIEKVLYDSGHLTDPDCVPEGFMISPKENNPRGR